MAENQYQWTDNPTVSGVSQCNTDVLNDCLMHLKYDKKDGGAGLQMFDTILKDHILTYEESKGLALQGTYVYKDAVAGSRYGYPDFYAKCLEEYQNSSNKKAYLKSNVSLTGSLTDNEGVLSGFSTSSYATLQNSFTSDQITEAQICFTTGSSITTTQGLFLGTVSDNTSSLGIYNGGLYLINKVSGSTPSYVSLGLSLSTGTKYYFKFTQSSTSITSYISTDGENYTEGTTVTRTQNFGNFIGYGLSNDLTSTQFLGTIDLNESYININGERWWSGTTTGVKNPNGHQFYDITDKESVDDIFATTGMAWYYGVDTENERIFLPRNNWYEQATADGSEVGQSVEAGLPNITGDNVLLVYNEDFNRGTQSGGALYTTMYKENTYDWSAGFEGDNEYDGQWLNLDASRSNPIYSNSDTVQPNAVKKLLYICVGNTESTSAVTDVVEVTTTENDTLPLLHHIPADELLENPSWLRSAGQWNDGQVYTTAYEYLVNEYVNGQAHIDTLTTPDGTEYTVNYKTIKGKKVVDVANESQVNAVYSAIGSAWYYIIDQANIQFKLPQSHNSECYTADPTRVGLDVSAGLPNITAYWTTTMYSGWEDGVTGAVKANRLTKNVAFNTGNSTGGVGITFDASLSNPIYNNSDTVTPPHTEFYLYFKVANAVQNLELLDAGEVLEAVSDIASTAVLKTENKAYIVETYQNGNSWYRVYSDGWCEQGGSIVVASGSQGGYVYSTTTLTLLKPLANLISWDCIAKHDAFGTGFGFDAGGGPASSVLVYQKNLTGDTYTNPFVIWTARGYLA